MITSSRVRPEAARTLRASQVPVLAIWGRNDEIFAAAGAQAFLGDVPYARIELLDGGHFLLESHLDEVTTVITSWLAAR